MVRDTKAAKRRIERAYQELGLPVRLTAKEGICLDSDACKSSGDPMLEAYADYSSMTKVLSNDVEMLRRGVVTPIHTHFDLADTGRVTSAKPNVMNPRRLAGVRECYVPRGYRE
jgi:DNA polymerase I-like protein with 3'-5' exonuclease and polymerase domains